MGKVKNLLLTIEETNAELATLAEAEREVRVSELFEKLLGDNEILRQHEAMSRAADLEDYSPFDTVNS